MHIPFCHRICPYCSFYKHTPGSTDMAAFVDALLREFDHWRERLDLRPRTIYLGGGTPSMLSPTHLDRLLYGLADRLDPGPVDEWTLEANPRTFDLSKALLMVEAGVTRVSLGVQSWNPRHLKILGRDHAPGEARESFRLLREAEIPTLNLDLMFSLPGQTLEEWTADLQETLALGPDHVSAYNLTYEEDTEFLEKFKRGEYTRDEETDAAFFTTAHDLATSAGFDHYETSNFARPGHASAHNRAYWMGEDYLGIGPGAVSTTGGKRRTNLRDTGGWIERVLRDGEAVETREALSESDWILERLALELRTAEGLRRGILPASALPAAEALAADGLLGMTGSHLFPTARGRLLVDSLAEALAEAVD